MFWMFKINIDKMSNRLSIFANFYPILVNLQLKLSKNKLRRLFDGWKFQNLMQFYALSSGYLAIRL